MQRTYPLVAATAVALLLALLLVEVSRSAQDGLWLDRVDPQVLAALDEGGQAEFLIYLKEQADLTDALTLRTKSAKGQYVFQRLTAVAERTQPPVVAALEAMEAEYRQFWVVNMIWARGGAEVVEAMARLPDVTHVYANPAVALELPSQKDVDQQLRQPSAVEWNLALVGAPQVWAAGDTGQGVVIGGQDTGYDWTHPALINQYRGWDGITATHDYNWHDAIHTSGSPCPADSPEPCDDHGHGTHTMGTMVGDDGGSNQIGMAPGAKWIGCRNMKQGVGTPVTYAECYQWFIAPTDLNDQNPDPAKAPHVINNSWACPPSEDCNDPDVLKGVVENVRAAGIVTVHSAGNQGPACNTVRYPAAIYDASFSVGATSANDGIASFSSRGPVTVDGSNRLKPDISAPGVGVRSSILGNGYGYKNGTSMAGPHVVGLVALLISSEPALAGRVDVIEEIIRQTAAPLTTTQGCGGDGPTDVPNHVYGYGRIDAAAAFAATKHALTISKTAAPQVLRGETLTYTISVTHQHPLSQTNDLLVTDTLPAGVTFVTATTPFSRSGSTISWPVGNLAADGNWGANLVVQVPLTASTWLINEFYGARSAEVTPVSGSLVTTNVRSLYTYYWPVFLKD